MLNNNNHTKHKLSLFFKEFASFHNTNSTSSNSKCDIKLDADAVFLFYQKWRMIGLRCLLLFCAVKTKNACLQDVCYYLFAAEEELYFQKMSAIIFMQLKRYLLWIQMFGVVQAVDDDDVCANLCFYLIYLSLFILWYFTFCSSGICNHLLQKLVVPYENFG